jgi:hypothetical protein
MKTQISKRGGEQASVLMVTILTAAVVGIVLMAYLNMTSNQNVAVTRSMTWQSAIPVMEAGIEEALTQVYYNASNLTANGWVATSDPTVAGVSRSGRFYMRERSLAGDRFIVYISEVLPPVIYSQAYVKKPLSSDTISRAVRVTTQRDGIFSKGLVAKGQITLNGNNVMVDSFDSVDPAYSSNGVYVVGRRKANGDVATTSGLVSSLSSGNADIYGRVGTGPGGSVAIGNNGAVGDAAWIAAGNNGIQPGHSSSDINLSFPEVKAPDGPFVVPGVGLGALANDYDYVITLSGNYVISGLSKGLLVRSNVQAVVYCTGDIALAGANDSIKLEAGASLNLYMQGTSASIAGQGVINQNANATNFMYWGMPANTSLNIKGNGSFTGTIYAPQADMTMGGGGMDNNDVVGASVTASVHMNGTFTFHYDENLARVGPTRAFVITSWTEL